MATRVDIGVYTALEIDLTQFDFSGVEKVIMTFKNRTASNILFTREFTTAQVHTITITPEELTTEEKAAAFDEIAGIYEEGDNGT